MTLSRHHLLLALLVLTAAQIGWFEPRLPDQVVSNFDYDGSANGWSSKGAFLGGFTIMMACTLVLFYVLSWTIRRMGGKGINVPHRDYWLAPERRGKTAAFVGDQLEIFGLATYAFLLLTNQLTISANLVDPPELPSAAFWSAFGAYMLGGFVWTIRLITRFSNKPVDDPEG